jgi:TatD DNase family protein
MTYYDIHTHQPPQHPGDIAVVSLDVSRKDVRKEILSNRLPFEKQASEPCSVRPDGYYPIGVHPRHTDMKFMHSVRKYASRPATVAIGETGLDKLSAKNENGFRMQQELFSAHAELSEEVRNPLIIHCVKAWEELLRIRRSVKPAVPRIIHGFRGTDILTSQLINAGLYLSFGTLYHTEALKIAWQEQRLLTETGETGINTRRIYKQIACNLNIAEENLAEVIACFFQSRMASSLSKKMKTAGIPVTLRRK